MTDISNFGDLLEDNENIINIREEKLLNFYGRRVAKECNPVLSFQGRMYCFSPGWRFAEALFVVSRTDSKGVKECKGRM